MKNFETEHMNDIAAKIFFIIVDTIAMICAVIGAFYLRNTLNWFSSSHTLPLETYLSFYPIYIITLTLFAYEGIYTKRYDFWHESRIILKTLLFSLIIVLAYLALSKTIQNYSRFVIILAFVLMAFFIPFFKRFSKVFLFKIGLWQKPALIYGDDKKLPREIYGNPYLGYVKPKGKEPKTVFINSRNMDYASLQSVIDRQLGINHEVLFIPLLNDFDLTHSQIYELANTRTNLISLQNRLKSRYRRIFKYLLDFILAILLIPIIFPILVVIAFLIKKEEPKGKILFKQSRLGKNGNLFICYKFRTMKEDGDAVLRKYLEKYPEESKYYEKYHKYKKDPRITKIGTFLRKTSLDELPQIFNVLKGEMSFVGPRPYMLDEKKKIGEKIETITNVRPGITGLWQVSGRNEVDFIDRINMDIWYIRNWNLWMDIVILIKTIKTVLARKGAS